MTNTTEPSIFRDGSVSLSDVPAELIDQLLHVAIAGRDVEAIRGLLLLSIPKRETTFAISANNSEGYHVDSLYELAHTLEPRNTAALNQILGLVNNIRKDEVRNVA